MWETTTVLSLRNEVPTDVSQTNGNIVLSVFTENQRVLALGP